jgi:tripartite-type tricarboxylate transporter receptor subunit TctC
MTYLLALDQGTSSSRSIVFDLQGRIVAVAQRELPQSYPQPGWVEHDPMAIWEGQLATAREALSQAKLRASDIRALGITSPKRSTLTPGIPAIAESYPGYDATNWYAFVAPGRTPKELIDRLNRELIRAMNAPEVREQLVIHGMEPQPTTPEELARIIEREYQTWGKVVREANIQAQ